MSWLRLETPKFKVGAQLDLDTRCEIHGMLLSGSDNIILVLSGPEGDWDGCPDVYHDDNGAPQPWTAPVELVTP